MSSYETVGGEGQQRVAMKYLHQRFGIELLGQLRGDLVNSDLCLQYATVQALPIAANAELATNWGMKHPEAIRIFLQSRVSDYLEFLVSEFKMTMCNHRFMTGILISNESATALRSYMAEYERLIAQRRYTINGDSSQDWLFELEQVIQMIDQVMQAQWVNNNLVAAGRYKNIKLQKQEQTVDPLEIISPLLKEVHGTILNEGFALRYQHLLRIWYGILNALYACRIPKYFITSLEDQKALNSLDELYRNLVLECWDKDVYQEALVKLRKYSGLEPEVAFGLTICLPKSGTPRPGSLVEKYLVSREMAKLLVY